MPTHSLKQEALESLQKLPENADIDEMMYRLYVINKLHKSREAIQRGEVINHENLKSEIEQW